MTFKYSARCSYHWATGKESINCFCSSKPQPGLQFHYQSSSNHPMEVVDQLKSISRNLLGEDHQRIRKAFKVKSVWNVISGIAVHLIFLTIFVWGKLLPCLLVVLSHQYNERLALQSISSHVTCLASLVPGKKGRKVIIQPPATPAETSPNV